MPACRMHGVVAVGAGACPPCASGLANTCIHKRIGTDFLQVSQSLCVGCACLTTLSAVPCCCLINRSLPAVWLLLSGKQTRYKKVGPLCTAAWNEKVEAAAANPEAHSVWANRKRVPSFDQKRAFVPVAVGTSAGSTGWQRLTDL